MVQPSTNNYTSSSPYTGQQSWFATQQAVVQSTATQGNSGLSSSFNTALSTLSTAKTEQMAKLRKTLQDINTLLLFIENRANKDTRPLFNEFAKTEATCAELLQRINSYTTNSPLDAETYCTLYSATALEHEALLAHLQQFCDILAPSDTRDALQHLSDELTDRQSAQLLIFPQTQALPLLRQLLTEIQDASFFAINTMNDQNQIFDFQHLKIKYNTLENLFRDGQTNDEILTNSFELSMTTAWIATAFLYDNTVPEHCDSLEQLITKIERLNNGIIPQQTQQHTPFLPPWASDALVRLSSIAREFLPPYAMALSVGGTIAKNTSIAPVTLVSGTILLSGPLFSLMNDPRAEAPERRHYCKVFGIMCLTALTLELLYLSDLL